MNDFPGIVARQVELLTGVVRAQKERRCREIVQAAQERAAALIRQSRREARTRVREAVIEERRRRDQAIVEAKHRLETEARKQVQSRHSEVLGQAWPRLTRELERRWADAGTRTGWCELLLDEAARLLGNDAWIIEHPDPQSGSWSADDAARLAEWLAARDIAAPELRADEALGPGLRIRRGGACLDGTIRGLLARRNLVEGRLLACWEIEAERAVEAAGD